MSATSVAGPFFFFFETLNFRRFITCMLLQTFLCVGVKCFCERIISKELWPPRSPGLHVCVSNHLRTEVDLKTQQNVDVQ